MPTENRSSNTEMVSVPEGFMLVERSIWTEQQVEAATACITRLKNVPGMRDCDLAMAALDAAQCKAPEITLADLLPAQQHQGNPVALPARKLHVHQGLSHTDAKADGWNACLDEIAKLGPLYTHADTAEVGRLRQFEVAYMEWIKKTEWVQQTASPKELGMHRAEIINQRLDTLRAQLAEAHALLRDIELTMDAQEDSVSLGYDIEMRMATILRPSASAEPSAPKCTYCGDTGQIMVGRSGDANDGNAPIMEPCEDCDGSGSSGGQMHSNGMDEPEYEPFKCETCDGFGSVPDGEITGAGGVEFESGPIQCVKDCPDCKPSAPVDRDERALIELALSEYGKATGKHVLPGGINENQDGFVHGFLVRAALERKPS